MQTSTTTTTATTAVQRHAHPGTKPGSHALHGDVTGSSIGQRLQPHRQLVRVYCILCMCVNVCEGPPAHPYRPVVQYNSSEHQDVQSNTTTTASTAVQYKRAKYQDDVQAKSTTAATA